MKCVHTIVVFDKQNICQTADWKAIHEGYVRSIKSIDNPLGTGKLKIRKKTFYNSGHKKIWRRNGVGYLRDRFLQNIVDVEDWKSEPQVVIEKKRDNGIRETIYTLPRRRSA